MDRKLIWESGRRLIVLPTDLILEGEDIAIRQDKWGEISIRPTSREGIKALDRFGPFAEWTEEDNHGADR
jgi:hypothetical protein